MTCGTVRSSAWLGVFIEGDSVPHLVEFNQFRAREFHSGMPVCAMGFDVAPSKKFFDAVAYFGWNRPAELLRLLHVLVRAPQPVRIRWRELLWIGARLLELKVCRLVGIPRHRINFGRIHIDNGGLE